ncbi:MAG: O-6-methylguanine DNA methyltransferase [Candidatus Bathyarchaeota archaeon B24]|nr:MAG: O-6-methylguanine DNA methyltransferase [Candidatus Bathyarchaeota archaeon B24]
MWLKVVKMNLYGFEVKVVFLVNANIVLAYAWHYDEKRALNHLNKIKKFHNLKGYVKKSNKLEAWLKKKIEETVIDGMEFDLPEFNYKNKLVYENIIKISKGKTATYAQIAKKSKVKYTELLATLMKNPFQVLIPCHRLLTNKGTLFGFYPLGKEVKRKLLELEGVRLKR